MVKLIKSYTEFYSERIGFIKTSDIRELLKLTQRTEIISFAGGLPNPEAFPVQEIHEIVEDVLKNHTSLALQYGTTEGVSKLREALASRMMKKGLAHCSGENILITTGSQQALDMIGKIFLNAGDVVISTAPTYIGAINAFLSYRGTIEHVRMDDDGIRIDELEAKIQNLIKGGFRIKLIYIEPTFHNPAGVTLSEERRKHLIEIAKKYNLLIVEDDPYSDLRYRGKEIKPLKAYDDDGRVIYLSTMSKILVPGFRCGFMVATEELIRKFSVAKQSMDLCSPTFTQFITYEYFARGYADKHIEKIKMLYGRKMKLMLEALEEFFPTNGVKWTKPDGGLFIWAMLPERINTQDMLTASIKENVAYVPGAGFYTNGGGTHCMRLNFSHPTDENIHIGIERLAKVIKKEIAIKNISPHEMTQLIYI